MAAGAALIAALDELIATFNRRSLDLPDGLFDRRTQFLLNGTPFEAMLGRAPGDPLVLLIARGPAGYRFAIKALQHAVPDARLERGDAAADPDADAWTVPMWLSGRLRGTNEPVQTVVRAQLRLSGTVVATANLEIDAEVLPLLREARLRE